MGVRYLDENSSSSSSKIGRVSLAIMD